MTLSLFKFNKFIGRQGSLEGLFITKPEKIYQLISSQTTVYFGEVLGKHSNVACAVKKEDITEIPVTENTILDLINNFGTSISGFNPLDYLENDENEDEEG